MLKSDVLVGKDVTPPHVWIVDSSMLYHFVLWPILSIVAVGRPTSIRLIIQYRSRLS